MYFLDKLFDRLFPITRSITGKGIEESLAIISEYMPLSIEKIDTGTQVFDWVVPPEWHFKRAILKNSEGEVVVDSDVNNLHVVNYSEPVDKMLDLEDLQSHLHSIASLPDAIPYVTSYYQRNWGFCISQKVRDTLKPGKYHAWVDSAFVDGGVPIAQCVLEGESTKEILLTSYLCHPSLANNELSGPLVLLGLYHAIKSWPRRRYTYRFLINPETIGSLCFLHRYHKHLEEKLACGFVLTCLGGPEKKLSYQQTRNNNSLGDALLNNLTISSPKQWDIREFDPTDGSDERQYNAPGFQLPIGQIARTIYSKYDAYHNSLDTKEFMGIESLVESIDQIETMLKDIEISGKFINLCPYGEPQLGKRGLYPNINAPEKWKFSSDQAFDQRTTLNRLLYILNYSDGQINMLDIAKKCNCTIQEMRPIIALLEEHRILAATDDNDNKSMA
nr:DUF4910 domain-containing protein [Cytophagales bacterium]